jgi:hypothetical protein
MHVSRFFIALLSPALLALSAKAAFVPTDHFVDPNLAGNTQYDQWNALTSAAYPGYPGFPGTGTWPAPMGSNAPGSADATLNKLANGAGGGMYPAGGSIYFGGFSNTINNNGGKLAVVDSTPVTNVANVVLQIDIGEAWTYDFWNGVLPTLSYNGGAQNVPATNTFLLNQYDNGTVTMPTGPETVYINSYLLQWDLSSVGPVTDYSIAFNGVQHGQLYALQLDQSDAFANYVPVPEPATGLLMALAGTVACVALRRRASR